MINAIRRIVNILPDLQHHKLLHTTTKRANRNEIYVNFKEIKCE